MNKQAIFNKLMKQHEYNQQIADKIQAVMKQKHCHLVIGVSSEGLRFFPKDNRTQQELNKLMINNPLLRQ